MTSHEFARLLLSRPDLPLVVYDSSDPYPYVVEGATRHTDHTRTQLVRVNDQADEETFAKYPDDSTADEFEILEFRDAAYKRILDATPKQEVWSVS